MLTSSSHERYMNSTYNTVTCHYLDDISVLLAILLTAESMMDSHNGKNFAIKPQNSFKEFNLNNVVAATADNSAITCMVECCAEALLVRHVFFTIGNAATHLYQSIVSSDALNLHQTRTCIHGHGCDPEQRYVLEL